MKCFISFLFFLFFLMLCALSRCTLWLPRAALHHHARRGRPAAHSPHAAPPPHTPRVTHAGSGPQRAGPGLAGGRALPAVGVANSHAPGQVKKAWGGCGEGEAPARLPPIASSCGRLTWPPIRGGVTGRPPVGICIFFSSPPRPPLTLTSRPHPPPPLSASLSPPHTQAPPVRRRLLLRLLLDQHGDPLHTPSTPDHGRLPLCRHRGQVASLLGGEENVCDPTPL